MRLIEFWEQVDTLQQESITLIRLRSPYGRPGENLNDWSRDSKQWDVSVSSVERQRLGVDNLADGEFYMSLADFVQTFSQIESVHLDTETSRDEPTLHGKGETHRPRDGSRNLAASKWPKHFEIFFKIEIAVEMYVIGREKVHVKSFATNAICSSVAAANCRHAQCGPSLNEENLRPNAPSLPVGSKRPELSNGHRVL
jgi:Calpain family cysteine protease